MQTDEEAKVVRAEEMRKLEVQLKTANDHLSKLQVKLDDANESNRIITQASRIKQEELETMKTRLEAIMEKQQKEAATEVPPNVTRQKPDSMQLKIGEHFTEAHSRFILDSSSASNMVLLKGKTPHFRAWLEAHEANKFLKRAQSSPNTKEMLIEHLARNYGVMMLQDENRDILHGEIAARDQRIEHLGQKCSLMQEKLEAEEEAKRRTLLRYVHAVKQTDPTQSATKHCSSEFGTIQLPESSISDEELHAVAALLRGDTSIKEVSLRDNMITDDGAHALASVLAGKSSLKSIDLRGNMITHHGVRIIAEALERSERVRHVYVHAGGKVEALGVGQWGISATNDMETSTSIGAPSANVGMVCCVDCRDNTIPSKHRVEHDNSMRVTLSPTLKSKRGPKFQTLQTRAQGSNEKRPMVSVTKKLVRTEKTSTASHGEFFTDRGAAFPTLKPNRGGRKQ